MDSVKKKIDDKKQYYCFLFLSGLLVINIFIWSIIFSQERDVLTVAFLDVGQGDAVFIEAPNGNQVLVDAGSNKKVLRQLNKVMPFYDRSIDVVLATHPDKDHIGGLPDVIDRYNIGLIFRSGAENDTGIYNALSDILEKKEVEQILARRGMIILLDDDVFLNILFPDRDVSGLEINSASIIAQLIYGDTEFMLTGDSPKTIEEYLIILDGENLESDVLKAGHHGSKTSSAEAFLGYVAPKYSVISAGKNNRYGHPHEEVLETLNQFGSVILSTQNKGMIVFESDGENVIVK